VLAHTLHLVSEGRLTTDGAPSLDSEYALKT
jgi:hypothetical protein